MNKSTIAIIEHRSRGLCESCGRLADDVHHILPKQMGGRHGEMADKINDARNLAAVCRDCHDLLHRRRKEKYAGEREVMLRLIKIKTRWEEWSNES
jgi:5-methylcytosine-specific restriction endonuclease McrA